MALDLDYWQALGDDLGWTPQFRDAAWTTDSSPRERGYVHYFIIHHAASTSEAGAVALMQPGGRTVSAQWVLCTDGKYRKIVSQDRRAWTSASWLDDIADTVETVNTSGDPSWGINHRQLFALAVMAVSKYRTGRLKALSRSYVIGHYEVLRISGAGYTTVCPGPSMHLDLIVELAQAIEKGLIGPGKGYEMLDPNDPIVKAITHRLDWLSERVGGTADGPSLSSELSYLKGRSGGAGEAPSLTDFARQHRDKLTELGSKIDALAKPDESEPSTEPPA